MAIVYLNGDYVEAAEARIPVDDRGFLFADGIYEVTPAYGGRFFLMDRHIDRMLRGLCALRIDADTSGLSEVHDRLLVENGLTDEPISGYWVARGYSYEGEVPESRLRAGKY